MEKQLNNEIDAPDERDIKADKIHENYMKDVVNATRRTIEEAVYEALDTGLDIRFINQCVKDSFIEYAENHPNDSTVKAMQSDFFEEPASGKNNDAMKENFMSQPIEDDRGVKDFIDYFNDPNYKVQKQDYMALIEYVSAAEKQYDSILSELNALKEQLGGIHDKKNPLTSMMENTQENVLGIGLKLNGIKDRIITFTQNALDTVKDKGLVVLNEISGFFKIKESLQSLNESLTKMAHDAERNVQKINAVSQEYHEMENRAANIGKLLMGKEASEMVKENGKLSRILQLPFSKIQKYTTEMSEAISKVIEKMQRLEDYKVSKKVQSAQLNESVKDPEAKAAERESKEVTLQKEQLMKSEIKENNQEQSQSDISGNLKVAQGNGVFVLSELGYRHRAAKGLNDIKPGQSLPEHKNKVPKLWVEKGWVKEGSPDALLEIQQNQTARAGIPNNRQPIIDLEP